jgi:hypothetical protein
MKTFDYSDRVQSNTAMTSEQEKLHLLQLCETRQYLTCGVSVVSDLSNSGVFKYQAQYLYGCASYIQYNYCSPFPNIQKCVPVHMHQAESTQQQ